MKAALNGVLNFSVLDGWWAEAHIEKRHGMGIGDGEVGLATHDKDAADLYRDSKTSCLPLYYDDRSRWIWMMKQSISKVGAYFNSTRMMRRYRRRPICHHRQRSCLTWRGAPQGANVLMRWLSCPYKNPSTPADC